MKKILVTAVLLLSLLSSTFSQKLQIGVQIGMGKAQLSNLRQMKNDFYGADRTFSGLFGISIRYNIGSIMAIEAELNYTRKGTVRYAIEQQYYYQSLPISLIFKPLGNEKKWQPFFKEGFFFALLSTQKERDLTHEGRDAIYLLEYSPVRRFDIGFTQGIGFDYQVISKITISMEACMEHGLRDVFGAPQGYVLQRKRIFNIAAWGKLGVKYGF
jgi:opacity protein-like surface antigen